jgi:hypothetical protein
MSQSTPDIDVFTHCETLLFAVGLCQKDKNKENGKGDINNAGWSCDSG